MKNIIAFIMLGIISFVVFSGCSSHQKVQKGDLVSIVYTAYFSDGTIFDQNNETSPLMFIVGQNQVISGLDTAVIGQKIGKTKKITITPNLGYGVLYQENLVQKIGKIIFDKINIIPEIGTIIKLDSIEGLVKSIETDDQNNEIVIFDINPRQTRDTLVYKITILAKQPQ